MQRGLTVATICAALLLLFGVASYSAVLGKSATMDEPFHLVAGYTHRFMDDYRINPEDPALFGRFAALPFTKNSLKIDTESVAWKVASPWSVPAITLFRTPGNDGVGAVNRSRLMFVLVGMALGSLIAYWAWELAGGTAAVIATTLYVLDPNFLAHAALVKNDVPTAFTFFATSVLLYKLGRGGEWYWLVLLAVSCSVAINVKFSGVLLAPIVAIVLAARAMKSTAWTLCGLRLGSRRKRLCGVAACLLVVGVFAWAMTWAAYGFRYAATPEGYTFDLTGRIAAIKVREHWMRSPDPLTFDKNAIDPDDLPLSALPAAALWVESHRLLPSSWLAGFMYTYDSTLIRPAYLLGDVRLTGWWYYFPLVMAFKTPIATLAAIGTSVLLSCGGWMTPVLRWWSRVDGWACTCLATAPLLYAMSAMLNNLNLGVRHALPVYPFLFVFVGVAGVMLGRLFRRGGAVGIALLVGLIAETATSYPNYLAFFNTPSGGSRGGLSLLSDSNLDWGQDLPLIAKWQEGNPNRKLYLLYFGTADPAAYGVKAVHLPGGWTMAAVLDTVATEMNEPGVIAVSATNLQGLYLADHLKRTYGPLLRRPFAVLGGTIYLYEFPPRE